MEIQQTYHVPVMPKETAEYLITAPEGCYVDCTLGGGGHTRWLLSAYPGIRVIALDHDEAAIREGERTLAGFGDRVRIFRENFKNLRRLLERIAVPSVDGVFLDLGVSSRQFDDTARGFGFQSPVLDMRMDSRLGSSARDLVNTLDAESMADIFYTLGEERASRPIARRIVLEREKKPIESGTELAAVVERVKPRRGRIHPATLVFQALRIAVNGELDSLSAIMADLPFVLGSGGRAVVLSYHSLEDRIVKHQFRQLAQEGIYRLLTRKVVLPTEEETRSNPRSRSARLRAAERI